MDSKSLNLCFFWHMHQPDYRGVNGIMAMPWVFMHAIKDYYEMPWLLSRYNGIKASFNITSPLIEQMNLYKEPLKYDYFLSLLKPHPSQLNDSEKTFLVKICKSTQYETMIKPLARYDELYKKDQFGDEELIDLETIFLLAWCGNYLRQENTLVKTLMKQERGYTQAQKTELLFNLCDFIQTILPFYATLESKGIISLSTTPYNHPILPLLLDMNNAKRANVHTTLPENPLSLKEDAVEQVERSIALFELTFGKKPNGFWPAEGAVDEASIAIYKAHNLRWIATDEAILFRSLENDDRKALYKTYSYNDLVIGFRDHELSDLIGFTYRFKSGNDATDHFMHALEHISKEQTNPTVFVILDGENAWEFFENNAYDFFTTFYHRLTTSSWCQTVTMDEVSKQDEIIAMDKLAPGSWINGSFDTWSGHSEKNRAWELIYQTRRDFENYSGVLSDEVASKIKFHFLASECSDWFWWYGDDHFTEFGSEFDQLFRDHLIAIYHLLNLQPPIDLFESILSHKSSSTFLIKPKCTISPIINGFNRSFFDWLGCGKIDERRSYSTMDRVRGPIDIMYYGHNESFVFMAFEGDMNALNSNHTILQVRVEETGEKLSFAMEHSYHRDSGDEFAIGERLELALSREHFPKIDGVHLRFELVNDDAIIQSMPGFGSIYIELAEACAHNWFV